MSGTLNIGQMVADVKNRVPIGLDSSYVIDRLNESFRWISQQESFVWNLRRQSVAVDPLTVDFPLPATADPGDLMSLYGSNYKYEIPFIPFERFSQQHGFTRPTPVDCPFSAWTIVAVGTPPYIGKLAPDTPLANPVELFLFFHETVVAVIQNDLYFPSPDEFDSMIVDLTEAEIKRRYNLFGWDSVQQKAQDQLAKLKDVYRSSKKYIQGMADQAVRTQEANLKRAE